MIRVFVWIPGSAPTLDAPIDKVPQIVREPGAVVWVVLDNPRLEEVEKIGRIFNFHPLEIEDCVNEVELPKLDEFEDHAYIITHGIRIAEDGEIERVELDSFVGRNWLVSSHLLPSRSLSSVRQKIERNPDLLSRGADFLLHAVLDAQVDNFMPLVDRFDLEIDRLEEEVVERPRDELVGEILQLRRQVAEVRRSIMPQRDVIGRLARHDIEFITPKCSIYFRDVYDHVVRIHDMLEAIRDVANGLTDSYRSMISQRLNEVMQRLTLISTIFLPMTFVASIFGMNFKYMPELDWHWGYPYALALMIGIGIGFYAYFRSQRWL